MSMSLAQDICITFVQSLGQAHRRTKNWKTNYLSEQVGWLARWQQLLFGPWWGAYTIPLIVLLVWAVFAPFVHFIKNIWVALAYVILGYTLPNIIVLLQQRIVMKRRIANVVLWSETINIYREKTGVQPEKAIQDLQLAIRDCKKEIKGTSRFMSFANSFLIGCITSGDLQKALLELLQSAFLFSPSNIFKAAIEVFKVNPFSTIVFVIYLAVWLWYYPKTCRILWMERALRYMELPKS